MTIIGSPVVVDASTDASEWLGIAKLTDTLSIVIYTKSGGLKARTITIGTTPTVNSETAIVTFAGSNIQAVVTGLSSTTAMVAYHDTTGGMEARILSVSGTTITAESATSLSNAPLNQSLAICKVTSTKALFCYSSSATFAGAAVILSVSGTTITENTIIGIEASTGDPHVMKCAAYSSTKALIVWVDDIVVDARGSIVDISGNTLTDNTDKLIESGSFHSQTATLYCIKMSSTKIVAGFGDSIGSSSSHYVLTLNGSTFDIGTVKNLAMISQGTISGAELDSTSLVVFRRTSSSGGGVFTAVRLDITGGSSDQLSDSGSSTVILSTAFSMAAPVDSSQIIIHYTGSSSVILISGISFDFVISGGGQA